MTSRTSVLIRVVAKGNLGARTQMATFMSVTDCILGSLTQKFLESDRKRGIRSLSYI